MFSITKEVLEPLKGSMLFTATDEQLKEAGFDEEQITRYSQAISRFKTQYRAKDNKLELESRKKRKLPSQPFFDEETLQKWMLNPAQYSKQLRQLSNYFYTTSAQYKTLIQYMSSKPTYDYVLTEVNRNPNKTVNANKYRKDYLNAARYADKIIQKTDLKKALTLAYKEDYVFAYECETDDSFFLMFLDPEYCSVTSIEDGAFCFEFNFGLFTGRDDLLESYPKEFQQKYKRYKLKNDAELQWQELDVNKTFCIKVNDEIPYYPVIPFSTIFDDIADLDDYRKIKKVGALNDTFMALIQKIPLDEKNPDINKFLIDLELAMSFHEMASESVPEGVSLITSPMTIEAVKTTKGNTDSTNVTEALSTLYTDSGISQFLFNSDKNSSVGLSKSIVADDQLVFNLLRQIERWANRKMKKLGGTYKFRIKMLDITHFNKEDVQKQYKESASLGEPVKLEYAASVGLTPIDFITKLELENDILKLHEKMIPLQSSYTQTSDGEVGQGRDKVSDSEASDETIKSRDRDSDARKKEG